MFDSDCLVIKSDVFHHARTEAFKGRSSQRPVRGVRFCFGVVEATHVASSFMLQNDVLRMHRNKWPGGKRVIGFCFKSKKRTNKNVHVEGRGFKRLLFNG